MRVLHVEDEKWLHEMVKGSLGAEAQMQWASSIDAALGALKSQSFDLILLDRYLNKIDSFHRLDEIKSHSDGAAILVLSSDDEVDSIEKALKLGAHDYIIKTASIGSEFKLRMRQALKHRDSLQKIRHHEKEATLKSALVGASEYTRGLQEKLQKLAQSNSTVLITGESGSGKEVIAKELNRLRGDSLRPFVVVNCGAISEQLFESEFFGHVKGAFTGAIADKRGLVAEANGGDLFLDEIGDLPLSQQVKLLRFIQDGSYTPVGSTKTCYSRVRLIAATNKDLEQAVREKKFREDLFYRLDIYRIHTRPLRERAEDIGPLAEYFTSIHSQGSKKVTKEALKLLERGYWQGNIRELSCVIQRALVDCQDDMLIRASHIASQNVAGLRLKGDEKGLPTSSKEVTAEAYETFVSAHEKAYLHTALRLFNADTDRLARALGLSRATVYNKIKRLGIKIKEKFDA